MFRAKIPFGGSFQKGTLYRKGSSLESSWKHLQRIGTIDNLARVAEKNGVDKSFSSKASLRIRQGIEFRESSVDVSILTKPLLLYYSVLNLVRGILFALCGDIGSPSHGLRYVAGDSLLSCTATILKNGTYPKLLETFQVPDRAVIIGSNYTLEDYLLLIPELQQEVSLLTQKNPTVAAVKVEAFINDYSVLKFFNTKLTINEFQSNWKEYFPWFEEECEYQDDHSLRIKKHFSNADEVIAFCHTKLMRDFFWREDAFWFDHINRKGSLLVPRLSAYLGALFILSNISRYEPEYLEIALQPTDMAYAINAFMDNAERCIPLMIIEMIDGPTYFT